MNRTGRAGTALRTRIAVLDDRRETVVEALGVGGRWLVDAAAVEAALGWTRKPQGWCRGDVCVPAAAAARAERADGLVDLEAFAALLGRPFAAEPQAAVVALGVSAAERGAAYGSGTAPDFTLPDAQGRPFTLGSVRGRKVALVFWASWCGCRYDLPEWERRHAELREHGFTVVSVAVDRRAGDAEPWIAEAGATHPALVDTDGAVADLYQVLNVPTVVWIDEEGRVVRPNDTQFATDLFRSMSGLDSARAMEALRRWVVEGEPGLSEEKAARYAPRVTQARQQAQTEAALGLWLHRGGHPEAAARHFAAAWDAAPEDVAIWRGVMPLLGEDPMGDTYFERRQALADAGIPVYRPLPDWQEAAGGR